MGGRLALVVGSECAALGELGFTAELAKKLYSVLSRRGGWRSATSCDGPLLDPTAVELVAAIDEAFRNASDDQATLLIGFIGHGTSTSDEDFFILGSDSPPVPNSQTAFHLTQGIRERLNRSTLDGLVVLVDACESEQGLLGAAHRWTDLLARSTGRMELLTASADGPAYSGCFTRAILGAFEAGLPLRGENILPSDLVDPIAGSCTRQQPQHLSFTCGTQTVPLGADPGLWLVPNVARRRDAVSGRSEAGLIDHLTRSLLLTEKVRECLMAIIDSGGHRLRGVTGPPGAGKSTLLAMLVRPSLVDSLHISPEYVTAAVFLNGDSSMELVADDIASQLSTRLPGYDAAAQLVRQRLRQREDEFDTFEMLVSEPLAQFSRAGSRVTIVVDGLDQPNDGARRLLVAAIAGLTTRDDLRHVRVIVGVREGTAKSDDPALMHMHRIVIGEPSAEAIAHLLACRSGDDSMPEQSVQRLQDVLRRVPHGGWLVVRLLLELSSGGALSDRVLERVSLGHLVRGRVTAELASASADDRTALLHIVGILTAAGAGPVLPLDVLRSTLSLLDIELSVARIRDLIVDLGVLIIRARPGAGSELLGIAHSEIVRPLKKELRRHGLTIVGMHFALATELITNESDSARDYARGSLVRHYLAYGSLEEAFEYLLDLEGTVSADNRDRWSMWTPAIIAKAGRRHEIALEARGRLAEWRSQSGDLDGAIDDYSALTSDHAEVYGDDSPEVLEDRCKTAILRGRRGEVAAAVSELEQILEKRLNLLGPDHPDTVITRSNLAHGRAEMGDVVGAVEEYERVLELANEVFGSDHAEVLAIRSSLADCQSELGRFEEAIAGLEATLADAVRILGPEHRYTHVVWNNLGAVVRVETPKAPTPCLQSFWHDKNDCLVRTTPIR
ncbi:tetratricopeptide repeat protein [Nocardia brasiliensis]